MAYLTAAQIKAKYPQLDAAGVTDDDIVDLVAEFEETAEDWIGVAFEERTETGTVIDTCRSRVLFFPHTHIRTVTALSVDGTAFTSDELTAFLADDIDLAAGMAERWTWGSRVVVTYTHGFDEPPNALLRACRIFVRNKALSEASAKPQEIIDYRDESGFSYRVGTPDPLNDRPTGVLEVDSVLNRLRQRYRVPVVA